MFLFEAAYLHLLDVVRLTECRKEVVPHVPGS